MALGHASVQAGRFAALSPGMNSAGKFKSQLQLMALFQGFGMMLGKLLPQNLTCPNIII